MRMPPFTLHTPDNLAKAIALAAELDSFDWISGGTDLLPNYKWKLNPKPDVISLSKVQELTALSGTVIGAMVGGGIGLLLTQAIITQSNWEEVTYYIILIILLVTATDWLSGKIRRRLIKGSLDS